MSRMTTLREQPHSSLIYVRLASLNGTHRWQQALGWAALATPATGIGCLSVRTRSPQNQPPRPRSAKPCRTCASRRSCSSTARNPAPEMDLRGTRRSNRARPSVRWHRSIVTDETWAQAGVSALRHGQQAGEAVSMATGREWKSEKWWIALPIATRTIDRYPLGLRGQGAGTSPGAAHTRAWAGVRGG